MKKTNKNDDKRARFLCSFEYNLDILLEKQNNEETNKNTIFARFHTGMSELQNVATDFWIDDRETYFYSIAYRYGSYEQYFLNFQQELRKRINPFHEHPFFTSSAEWIYELPNGENYSIIKYDGLKNTRLHLNLWHFDAIERDGAIAICDDLYPVKNGGDSEKVRLRQELIYGILTAKDIAHYINTVDENIELCLLEDQTGFVLVFLYQELLKMQWKNEDIQKWMNAHVFYYKYHRTPESKEEWDLNFDILKYFRSTFYSLLQFLDTMDLALDFKSAQVIDLGKIMAALSSKTIVFSDETGRDFRENGIVVSTIDDAEDINRYMNYYFRSSVYHALMEMENIADLKNIKMREKLRAQTVLYNRKQFFSNPNAMFLSHISLINEVNRPLLFLFEIANRYRKLLEQPNSTVDPIHYLLVGQAPMDYEIAYKTLTFALYLSEEINHNLLIKDKIKLYVLPDISRREIEDVRMASDVIVVNTEENYEPGQSIYQYYPCYLSDLVHLNEKDLQHDNQEIRAQYMSELEITKGWLMEKFSDQFDVNRLFTLIDQYGDAHHIYRDFSEYQSLIDQKFEKYQNRVIWDEERLRVWTEVIS